MNGLFRSFLPVVITAACGSTTQPKQPTVGDTFQIRSGEYFRGWLREGAGLGINDQGYALFSRGDSFIVALTSPVKRDSRGGIQIEKITKAVTVTAQSGEKPHHGIDCGWMALGPAGDPVVAFYNPRNGVVRGYFAAKDRIFVARWTSKRGDCQYHSD